MNPLDQLRDMHLPPPPGLWPPAPGWWLLIALVLVLGIAGIWWWLRRRRANRYRREALAMLAQTPEGELSLPFLLQLLRRTALSANPDSPWISLPANQLLERLDAFNHGNLRKSFLSINTNGNDVFIMLSESIYRREKMPFAAEQQEALIKAVGYWIRKHGSNPPC